MNTDKYSGGFYLGAVAVGGEDLELDEIVDKGRVVLVGQVDDC